MSPKRGSSLPINRMASPSPNNNNNNSQYNKSRPRSTSAFREKKNPSLRNSTTTTTTTTTTTATTNYSKCTDSKATTVLSLPKTTVKNIQNFNKNQDTKSSQR